MYSEPAGESIDFLLLRDRYIRTIPEKLRSVSGSWNHAFESGWKPEPLQRMRIIVHRLAGSGASYGFSELSSAAKELEEILVDLGSSANPERMQVRAEVAYNRLVTCLSQTQNHLCDSNFESSLLHRAQKSRNAPIFVVEDDREQANFLRTQLAQRGHEVRVFHSVKGVVQQAAKERPGIVLVDIIFPEDFSAGLGLAEALGELGPPHPEIVLLSARSDLTARRSSVRLKVAAYLEKPVSLPILFQIIDRLFFAEYEPPPGVLFFTDDEDSGDVWSKVLLQSGMRTCTVNTPQELPHQLVHFHPDLVVLDFAASDASNMDLIGVVRQSCYYAHVPIIVLANDVACEMRIQALEWGADDYLCKPIPPDLAVAHAQNRIRRYREIARSIDYDHLTGVYNRPAFLKRVGESIARSQRLGTPASLALIDVDNFKQVNDQNGHLIGDAVLRETSRRLSCRLRRSDLIGRYSGDEFVLFLPETSAAAGAELLDQIRSGFAQDPFVIAGVSLPVTVSIGIAQLPHQPSYATDNLQLLTEELLDASDHALYQAKRAGRNRLSVHELEPH